jgi:hypothetical protein
MHTQEAVVVTAAGGIIATIKVESLNDKHTVEALDLMHRLIAATHTMVMRSHSGDLLEPVVGMRS